MKEKNHIHATIVTWNLGNTTILNDMFKQSMQEVRQKTRASAVVYMYRSSKKSSLPVICLRDNDFTLNLNDHSEHRGPLLIKEDSTVKSTLC